MKITFTVHITLALSHHQVVTLASTGAMMDFHSALFIWHSRNGSIHICLRICLYRYYLACNRLQDTVSEAKSAPPWAGNSQNLDVRASRDTIRQLCMCTSTDTHTRTHARTHAHTHTHTHTRTHACMHARTHTRTLVQCPRRESACVSTSSVRALGPSRCMF